MINLTDFFQPLNLFTVSCIIGLFLFFDILGTKLKNFFIKDQLEIAETRILNWLLGLSFFTFIWFLAGFFIEPNRNNLLISIVILFIVSLSKYKFIKINIKNVWLPIVLLLPFLPAIIVKTSLPPYYNDELNYHFISPYQVINQLKMFWIFNGGTLMNSPRLMDNLYILTFSLSHTYSVVRFIQFLILPTVLLFSYQTINKLFGKVSAFLFVLIFLSIPLDLHLISTIGYVDFPAHLFMLVGIILGIEFLLKNSSDDLILSVVFWGMSIGTKYTSILPFIIFFPVLFSVYCLKTKSLKNLFEGRLFLKVFVLFIIFGGYWYVKNFIVYGNPIYPFLFKCWGKYNTDYCGAGSSFFGLWTTPITLKTIYIIIGELISNNILLISTLVISPVLVFFTNNIKVKLAIATLVSTILLVFLGLKYSSGFYLRYQQYLIFFLILTIVVSISVKFKSRILKIIQYLMILMITISCSLLYLINVRNAVSAPHEKDYFFGKTSVYDWVGHNLPNLKTAITWCDNQTNEVVPVTTFDSSSIAQYLRPFLVNCYWLEPDLNPNDWENVVKIAREMKLRFITMSMFECNKTIDKVRDNKLTELEFQMKMINNEIVCKSEKVFPNFYYFDYQKL